MNRGDRPFEVYNKQDGLCTYNVTFRLLRAPLLQWKTVNIIYCECVFLALGIQHAMRMRLVMYVCVCVYIYIYIYIETAFYNGLLKER